MGNRVCHNAILVISSSTNSALPRAQRLPISKVELVWSRAVVVFILVVCIAYYHVDQVNLFIMVNVLTHAQLEW